MVLEDYFQVNSQFFYGESLDMSYFTKHKEVPISNFTEDSVKGMLENVEFGKIQGIMLNINTNKGQFLYISALDQLDKDTVLNFLKHSSTTNPTYYFSNVDYFSFGRFGLGEGGKITRYLSFNSEQAFDEEVVGWIGKPHSWEYATHTFYTKKKLEDFEMDFSDSEVCDMVTYYLPFISEDIVVDKVSVYTLNKQHAKLLKNIVKGVYHKLTNKSVEAIYNTSKKYKANMFSIACYFDYVQQKIIFANHNMYTYKDNGVDIYNTEVLYTNLRGEVTIGEPKWELDFHNILLQMVADIPRVKPEKIKDIGANIKTLEDLNLKRYLIMVRPVTKSKLEYHFFSTDTKGNSTALKVGTKFNKSLVKKIFKLITS